MIDYTSLKIILSRQQEDKSIKEIREDIKKIFLTDLISIEQKNKGDKVC